MATRPLDAAAIVEILDRAGPAFLAKIHIEPFFMANLVQAGIIDRHGSQAIQETGQIQSRNALLAHLYTVSTKQFIDFCLVLCDKQNKQDLVTEHFRLDIEQLRAQQGTCHQMRRGRDISTAISGSETTASLSDEGLQSPEPILDATPEELAKIYTALKLNDIEKLSKARLTDFARLNEMEKETLCKDLRKCILSEYPPISQHGQQDIRIVLLGITGAGKSATGNLILGETCFKETTYTESCTQHVQFGQCKIDNIDVCVADTPGFFDTRRKHEDIMTEMCKLADHFEDGFDALLFVFNMASHRFTPEQRDSFQYMVDMYGESAIDSCFVIFTHFDCVCSEIQSLTQYLVNDRNSPLVNLVREKLQKRAIGVNNAEKTIYGRELQRRNIIRLILARKGKRFSSPLLGQLKKEEAAKRQEKMKLLAPIIKKIVYESLPQDPPRYIQLYGGRHIVLDILPKVMGRLAMEDQHLRGDVLLAIESEINNYK